MTVCPVYIVIRVGLTDSALVVVLSHCVYSRSIHFLTGSRSRFRGVKYVCKGCACGGVDFTKSCEIETVRQRQTKIDVEKEQSFVYFYSFTVFFGTNRNISFDLSRRRGAFSSSVYCAACFRQLPYKLLRAEYKIQLPWLP